MPCASVSSSHNHEFQQNATLWSCFAHSLVLLVLLRPDLEVTRGAGLGKRQRGGGGGGGGGTCAANFL